MSCMRPRVVRTLRSFGIILMKGMDTAITMVHLFHGLTGLSYLRRSQIVDGHQLSPMIA